MRHIFRHLLIPLTAALLLAAACAPPQAVAPVIVVPNENDNQNVILVTSVPTRRPPTATPTDTPTPTPDPVLLARATCDSAVPALWSAASDACIGKPPGFVCNGGSAPQVQPGGAVGNALSSAGSLVEIDAVQALRTARIMGETGGGVAWLRIGAPVGVRVLLLGDVDARNVTPPDFPAWQSMVVQTGAEQSPCEIAPVNAAVIQSDLGVNARIVVNGVSMDLNGTVLVHTTGGATAFVALSGTVRVLAASQIADLVAGQQTLVPDSGGDFSTAGGAPSVPAPLDINTMRYLPVALFDRPIFLPQPGFVITQGQVNLRTEPDVAGPLLFPVEAGTTLTVLGRNPAGDWYHVMLPDGSTGWMFAQLLNRNVGEIVAVYTETPLPPQRYGDLGARGSVIGPAGVNLREAPDVTFPQIGTLPFGAEVILLARSPYSPWVKIDWNGTVGWVALLGLETQAVFEALPYDFSVPPPPEPTAVPGSFGNAFPDPDDP